MTRKELVSKAIFTGVLLIVLIFFVVLKSYLLIPIPGPVAYHLEFKGGTITNEIGLLSLEFAGGDGGILNFYTEKDKVRLVWSSICYEMTKKDPEKYFYIYRYYGDKEQEEYLYIYRFYNDSEHTTIWVKPGTLFNLTGKILEIRPQEIANLFIKTDLRPSADTDSKLLEILKKIKVGGISLGYRTPTGYPATPSNLVIPSE